MQELKLMMEKLGNPQTHSSLKSILSTVDEDKDNLINYREVNQYYNYKMIF